jgi:protein gp37
MGKTSIEWTDTVWNPVTGCSHVSEGCRNCYAERFMHRWRKDHKPWTAQNATHNVTIHAERLEQPLHWRTPRRVFVNSMSDLFHEAVPDEFIDRLFAVMTLAAHHKFQILTKRPERMKKYLEADSRGRISGQADPMCESMDEWYLRVTTIHDPKYKRWPLPNVWLGVSVENQETADERIPLLLQTPAAVRFVSVEPMLGPVDLQRIARKARCDDWTYFDGALTGFCASKGGGTYGNRLDWVIVGGESGPKARPMHLNWARSVRDQCKAAGVPYFHKQNGEFVEAYRFYDHRQWVAKASTHVHGAVDRCVDSLGKICLRGSDFMAAEYPIAVMRRVGRKSAGRLLDGREWNEFPEAIK